MGRHTCNNNRRHTCSIFLAIKGKEGTEAPETVGQYSDSRVHEWYKIDFAVGTLITILKKLHLRTSFTIQAISVRALSSFTFASMYMYIARYLATSYVLA